MVHCPFRDESINLQEKLDEYGKPLTDSDARNDVDINLIQVLDVLTLINDKLNNDAT